MIEAINIVSFDVPFPANYGGVIDVFYKIKTFHRKGVKVYLHCFDYGRGEAKELEQYCEKVFYYKRNMSPFGMLSSLPFIIKSRISKDLKSNLLSNNYPILFEGLHTCYLLTDNAFASRVTIFRESNIEHEYYKHLAHSERNWIKKQYLKLEVKRLKRFEPIIEQATHSFIVSEKDWKYFKKEYPKSSHFFIPSFHSGEQVNVLDGVGDYILFHGNLSVSENYDAAEWSIKHVFAHINTKVIVAGLNPPEFLKQLINTYNHIELIENPEEAKMKALVAEAQINFLYTNQATGLKLKLLNVLYHGRHCVVNDKMVWGTTLSSVCEVGETSESLITLIKQLINVELTEQAITQRKELLLANYSNDLNFERINNIIG